MQEKVGFEHSVKKNPIASFSGLFADMFSEATELIRQALIEHETAFFDIIENSEFKKQFIVLGKQLKRMPRGYEAFTDSSIADYLKYKNMYLEFPLTDQEILTSKDFTADAVEKFLLIKDFNHFLNSALKYFRFPDKRI